MCSAVIGYCVSGPFPSGGIDRPSSDQVAGVRRHPVRVLAVPLHAAADRVRRSPVDATWRHAISNSQYRVSPVLHRPQYLKNRFPSFRNLIFCLQVGQYSLSGMLPLHLRHFQ